VMAVYELARRKVGARRSSERLLNGTDVFMYCKDRFVDVF
jgi:hypothetical protein